MKILDINNLVVSYNDIPIVRNVSLSVEEGKFLGIVGESGCGKTTLLNSIMALKRKNSKTDGFINFCGEEITKLSEKKLRELRGNEIAMMPQNAFLSMDPTKTIASMFFETVKVHNANAKKRECFEKAVEFMSRLLLNDPERILKSYPFELSGGMCQRVDIVASMINSPKLLLGDEPTSALDVTSQEEVVNQLKYLKNNFKVSAVIISHNIGVISMLSDYMAVMYGGKILEYGKTENVLYNPSHPYTKALIEAMPDMDGRISGGLTGSPPVFTKNMKGCPFAGRCTEAETRCFEDEPSDVYIAPEHRAKCFHLQSGGTC